MMPVIDSTSPIRIDLPRILDIGAASQLMQELIENRGKDLVINAADVDRVGTQCLQVLCSAAKTWRADSMSLVYADISDRFQSDISTVGIPFEALLAGE